jgi:hypothetical protein
MCPNSSRVNVTFGGDESITVVKDSSLHECSLSRVNHMTTTELNLIVGALVVLKKTLRRQIDPVESFFAS